MESMYYASPIGTMKISARNDHVIRIEFVEQRTEQVSSEKNSFLAYCVGELREYFDGKRTSFTIPTQQNGTPFQQSVWRALMEIPFGETRTYGQLALALGSKDVVRAVGAANGQNNIPIIVPCHRVIGHDGKLVGFAYGIERKRYLLEHEKMMGKSTTQLSLY